MSGRKCWVALLGLLPLAVLPLCWGQQMGADHGTDHFISEVNRLVGRAALSLGDTHLLETETMPGLLNLWNQRQALGAGNFDLSNAFLFAMEENPQAFFISMSAHPSAFAEWIKELPDLSFTWFKAPPCQLDRKRSQLILILEHTQIEDAKASQLKDETLAKLSEIRCRQVQ